MRLWLSRRKPGPAAAHNSHFGPEDLPRITGEQRDAIYEQIVDRLGGAGDLALLVEQNDIGTARRLAREVTDDLLLVSDALGWGVSVGGSVELALPPDQLRRTFSRLRERAVEHREAGSGELAEVRAPHEQALVVIEACDQVLAMTGGSQAGG